MSKAEFLTPQEREVQRVMKEVGQGSMPWQVLDESNAEEIAESLRSYFEGHRVCFVRIDEQTKEEEFVNEEFPIFGRAIEKTVQFWSDPEDCPYHHIRVTFAGPDTEDPRDIRIEEGQEFYMSPRRPIPVLALRLNMYPCYAAAVRTHYTGDDSAAQWKQAFYIGMPF